MNLLKFALGLMACVLLRLVFLQFPNFEPIVAMVVPVAASMGGLAGFLFALVANASFDFISGRIGSWTLYTSLTYGIVGFGAWFFLKGKELRIRHFVGYSVVGVLFFDLVTALLFGWQFGQTLQNTLLGQIPFTLNHLAGALFFSLTITPVAWAFLFKQEAPAAVASTA